MAHVCACITGFQHIALYRFGRFAVIWSNRLVSEATEQHRALLRWEETGASEVLTFSDTGSMSRSITLTHSETYAELSDQFTRSLFWAELCELNHTIMLTFRSKFGCTDYQSRSQRSFATFELAEIQLIFWICAVHYMLNACELDTGQIGDRPDRWQLDRWHIKSVTS